MDEEKIKNLRYSFSNPKEDMMLPQTNQFGHTILGNPGEKKDLSNYDLTLSETGEPQAQLRQSVFDTEHLTEWYKKAQISPQTEQIDTMPSEDYIEPKMDLISGLISQLDEMTPKPVIEKPTLRPVNVKSCVNSQCMYGLPVDAKFCLKCGTAQLARFCTGCGFNFAGEEKFCPDCGNKR